MSLIQEALKRQQEEKSGKKDNNLEPVIQPADSTPPQPEVREILPGISAIPPVASATPKKTSIPRKSEASPTPSNVPPPPPPPPASEQHEKAPLKSTEAPPPSQIPILKDVVRPQNSAKLKILAGGLVLIVGLVFVFTRSSKTPEIVETTTPEPIIENTQPEPVLAETKTETVTTTVAPEETAITAKQPPQVIAPTTKPAPEQIIWPSLTLTSVMGKGTKGSALINGQLIGVGDSIEGVKFKSVGQNGVYLEFKGKTRFLKRGQTTY